MLLIAFMLQAASASQSQCDNAGGDLEIAQCWTHAFEQSDNELNRAWPEVLKAAIDADNAFSAEDHARHPAAAADLRSAQRAWLKYRDSECALESDYAQGGSLQPIISGRCLTELTRARTKQLRAIASGFREG